MLYPSETVSPLRRTVRLVVAGALLLSSIFALAACDSVERFAVRSQRGIANFFTFSDHEEYTAQELALNGMEAYEHGNYRAAARNFQELKDFYPFSQYAALADLKLGDSYYQRRQYDKAVEAYQDFERLHPRNEAVPYVIYKIGMCYFDQMPTVDRDQSVALKAMEAFQRLQRQFPGNEYAVLADPLIPECVRKLAGHEFSIGLFYFETKHWIAAKLRFEKVLRNYPDVGYHREAMIYLVDCERRIKETVETGTNSTEMAMDMTAPVYATIGEQDLQEEHTYILSNDPAPPTDEELIQEVAPDTMLQDIPFNEGEVYMDM